MKKLASVLMVFVLASVVRASIVSPQAYWSFEGNSGVYGAGSNANPAWGEKVSGQAPGYIGAVTAPAWPEITTDGVKGDAFYAADSAKIGQKTMTLSWTSDVKDIFSSVESYTVCGWLNTRDAAKNGSDTYLLKAEGAGPIVKWRADGRLQFMDSADATWRYSDWGDGVSQGDWVFFAITRDSGSVSFYVGSESNAVAASTSATGLTIGATVASTRFVLGGSTYNGTDNYAGYDMDELRVYSAAAGDGGALTLSQLEEIRLIDLTPIPPPVIDAASIVGISFISGSIVKLEVDIQDPGSYYKVKGCTDLVIGASWTNWPHSDDGEEPFVYTNLNYSSTDGTNTFIYVQGTNAAAFFKVDGEQP